MSLEDPTNHVLKRKQRSTTEEFAPADQAKVYLLYDNNWIEFPNRIWPLWNTAQDSLSHGFESVGPRLLILCSNKLSINLVTEPVYHPSQVFYN